MISERNIYVSERGRRHGRAAVFSLIVCALLFIGACASINQTLGLGTAEKTKQLKVGMKYERVEALLGKPEWSKNVKSQRVVRWNLHELWRGWVPYDMVFDGTKQTLISWSVNEKDYNSYQEALIQMFGTDSGGAAGTAGEQAPAASDKPASTPQKTVAKAPPAAQSTGLMRQMAGTWYSFSGSGLGYSGGTERRVILCPDGAYYSSSESGYSSGAGTGDAWGTASQGRDRGTWRIQGTVSQGTIVTTAPDGSDTVYQYQSCGSGCYYFGGTKFAYEGPANCP